MSSEPRDKTNADARRVASGGADDRQGVRKVVYALAGICAVLLAVDPLVHKHGYFEVEHWLGFYGIYGFVACVVLLLAARVLRKLVMRSEDYYD